MGTVEVAAPPLPSLFDLVVLLIVFAGGDMAPEVLECRERAALSTFSFTLAMAVHSLVNCNNVSGKFGGVAGVFAGVFIYHHQQQQQQMR